MVFGPPRGSYENIPPPLRAPESDSFDVVVRRQLELRELDELAALLRKDLDVAGARYTDAMHHAASLLLEVLKHRWAVACGLPRPGYAGKTWVT